LCFMAFMQERCWPVLVLGPVLCCALARLISLIRSFVSDIWVYGYNVAVVLGAGGAGLVQVAEGVGEIYFFGR